jgi:HTH-type transcriptional regulator / antitoxin HigA
VSERIPAEVFPPGEYIKEELEERGWTQNDLAEVLGRPIQLVNEVILDKRGVTPETAKGLAAAFGTSAQLWLNLDAAWQLYKTRNTGLDLSIERRARIYSKAPVKDMVKRGWIQFSTNPDVLEDRLLKFFVIQNLDETPPILPAAARKSTSYEHITPSQWAWMCRAMDLGRAVSVQRKFDPTKEIQLLQSLRALLHDPEEVRQVPKVLSEWGIRFVVLEHLPKTRIDGACLWLDQDSPIIAVSLRYDRIDWFWFTLMHEVKHALSRDGQKNAPTLDVELVGEGVKQRADKPAFERDADRFAERTLIPPEKLEDFLIRKGPLFSEVAIRGFAALHQVHPGLVVGQLHHKGMHFSKFRHFLVKIRGRLVEAALTDGWGHSAPATI